MRGWLKLLEEEKAEPSLKLASRVLAPVRLSEAESVALPYWVEPSRVRAPLIRPVAQEGVPMRDRGLVLLELSVDEVPVASSRWKRALVLESEMYPRAFRRAVLPVTSAPLLAVYSEGVEKFQVFVRSGAAKVCW